MLSEKYVISFLNSDPNLQLFFKKNGVNKTLVQLSTTSWWCPATLTPWVMSKAQGDNSPEKNPEVGSNFPSLQIVFCLLQLFIHIITFTLETFFVFKFLFKKKFFKNRIKTHEAMKLQVFLLVVSLSGCFCANLVANLQGRDLVGFIRDVSGEGAQKPTWSCWRVGWSVGWAGCYCGSLVGFYQLFKGPKALYIVITKFVGYDQIDHCPKFQGSLFRPKGPTKRGLKKTTEFADFGVFRWSGDIRWPKVDWNMAWKPSRELDPHQAVEKPSRSLTVRPKGQRLIRSPVFEIRANEENSDFWVVIGCSREDATFHSLFQGP